MLHPEVKRRFGRDPKIIFERDNWKCLICGSDKDLTIDHIDGNGRKSLKPNNDPDNLRVLCRKCHGRKDGKRGLITQWSNHIKIERKCIICKKMFIVRPCRKDTSKFCSRMCWGKR